jgi:toxin ParE1/3/4
VSRYRLSRAAESDLEIIFWHGLEQFGEAQTNRYVTELEQTFDYLGRYPKATRLRTEIRPPIRAYPKGAHVIIYEIEGEDVLIVRVRSARENWTLDPLGGSDGSDDT